MPGITGFGGGPGGGAGGEGVPAHPDSEQIELQYHWDQVIDDEDYFEYLISVDEYANEIINSEEAMRAVFRADLNTGENE